MATRPKLLLLTPKQRKVNVAVAEDVLKLMRVLKITEGIYMNFYSTYAGDEDDLDFCGDAAALQKAIPKIAKHCEVCAKGAMVLAHIHLYDGVKHMPSNGDTSSLAFKYFGKQGDLIETAFELCHMGTAGGQIASECVEFGQQFDDAKLRLRAIMKNLIANNGRFVPSDLKNKGPKPRAK